MYVKTSARPARSSPLARLFRRANPPWDFLGEAGNAVAAQPGVFGASVGAEEDGLSAFVSVDEPTTAAARAAAAAAVKTALESIGLAGDAESLLVYGEDGRLIEDVRVPR